jgi:hypothetical protein
MTCDEELIRNCAMLSSLLADDQNIHVRIQKMLATTKTVSDIC